MKKKLEFWVTKDKDGGCYVHGQEPTKSYYCTDWFWTSYDSACICNEWGKKLGARKTKPRKLMVTLGD